MPPGPIKRFARAVARPLTGPIDGRVGDINRRVGEVNRRVEDVNERLEELERGVGANVTTVVESSSYLGVELRRLTGELEALREHVDDRVAQLAERTYLDRLAHTAEAPLAELDGVLAAAINRATGHTGFAAQAGMWFNPPITVELGEGRAQIGAVNERIVELPFAFGVLPRFRPGAKVLDVGGAESSFGLSAASLGYEVTVVDPRPLPFEHPNLRAVVARLDQWRPADERFDGAFLISTIEHIGLGAYGEGGSAAGADREALETVAGLLAPEGLVVVTVPFGNAGIDQLERVYDGEALSELLEGWTVLEERFAFRRSERTWTASPPAHDGAAGVAMVLAQPAVRGAAPPR